MSEDADLLQRYATEQSEAAFAELTRRHVDLVYSAALRVVYGDVESAQDVTQQVFAEVARHAKRLARHPALVGWLYTTTRLMALRVNRTEQRRKAREQEAETMNELLHDDASSADWDHLGPVLEEAMHELDDKDRHAVLLRFFQRQNLSQVGAALNLSENAARMRVERAVEKLRGILARRGITTTAGALTVVISTNAVQAAPAGFVATLSGAALAASAVHTSTLITATQTLAMTTIQKTIVAASLAAAVGTGIYAVHQNSELNGRIQTLEQEKAPLVARIRQLEQERNQASTQLAAFTEENAKLKSRATPSELLRLRGQVGMLRQQVNSNQPSAAQPAMGLAKMMSDPAMKDYIMKAMQDKMKSMYADFIKERNLTPEQTHQFTQLISAAGSKELAQLAASGQPTPEQAVAKASPDVEHQLRALLGDAGCARFQEFSRELPARTTITLLNEQLGSAPLTAEQSASLLRIIKAEPDELTRGVLGAPDKAFLGSQSEIDQFLAQLGESNQRILQQAATSLKADQLATLDTVLAKAVEDRKLQGAAFFQKR